MCGRFTNRLTREEIVRLYRVTIQAPPHNLPPTPSSFSEPPAPAFRHLRIESTPYSTAHIAAGAHEGGWCNGDYYSQTPD
jgi:hypothetical protein